MKYGVYVQNFGEYGDPHNLLALARDAEDAGWDGFFLWDHLLIFRSSEIPFVDAWVALSAIAAQTNRIRIGPIITPLARRRPWKVAREVATLDRLSQGRLVLGVGLGAPADTEFACFGEDPDDRIRARKLDEGLAVLDGLLRGDSFTHHGEYFHVDDVKFVPRAIQTPRVPIWVAGFWPNRPPMRRAARWDGVFPLKLPPAPAPEPAPWSSLWLTPRELRAAVAYVSQHRATDDAYEVVASGATPLLEKAQGTDLVAAFGAVGATWWLEWLDEQRGTFAQMRDHIRKGPPKD